ncbi:MAG: efflux RND transporter permease subunit [Chitinophagaceae bacterium]|nr:efflux RND transporter permease subunit [Chitinophagaceae bacterium]
MNLADISLKRPVFAIVINLAIILFGLIGYRFLGIRDYPAIDPPNISVSTSYAGANSDIIESQITEPLEKAINGIQGVKNITSSSSQGRSNINVEFELGSDLEAAANDVRDKVSRAARSLPQDIDAPPVVSKSDADAQPIIAMTVQSNSRNQLEVTEYANNNLVERLQTIPGVSSVSVWGEKRYAMRIWFDPEKLNAYNVSFEDVQRALQTQSVELPSGKLSGDRMELTIRTFGRLYTEEDFANLIVKNVNGVNIKVKDIGEVVLGPESIESGLKESGTPMIMLAIIPLPGSNYVSIADEFYKRVAQLKIDMPEDFKLDIATDQTVFIKRAISEVEETLFIALGLVILIIFVFFRDWIIALRPLFDIPVSLIGAFFIMYIFGFSINVLTLLGIVLATGLVVDDGIVVTENIFKKIERGMDKHRAASEGTREIYFAVIATSLTLAVVFLPIVFLQGFVGRLFREFGIVVAGAVLISAFVSLTLTPVLNVKMTRKKMGHTRLYRWTEPFFTGMESGYKKSLAAFMKIKWVTFILIGACLAIIYFIYQGLPSELAPMEDRSQFRLSITGPEGANYEYMEHYMDKLDKFLMDSVPERDVMVTMVSPGFGGGSANSGMIRVTLTDPKDRVRSQQEIVDMVNRNLSKFSEGRAFAMQDQTISVSRRGGQPVQYVLQNNDFEKIREVLPKFLDAARESHILQAADADLKFNKPELRIKVDRLRASELGVSVTDINHALELAYSDRRLGYFYKGGKQYSVLGQVDRKNREDPRDISKIMVRNNQGKLINIDNLVTTEEASAPPTIYHFNRYKSATISAGLQPGYTVGDGIAEMDRISKELLDETFNTALTGTSRDFQESSGNTMFAFVLALILIYLVLAAQFESFIDPFIIMVTVPLALAGALLSLWVFDQTFNIFSQIGMIMLIGLVTKNGILIVEFANQLRDRGMEKSKAVVEAAYMRLRPILMTSLAMSLGALPIALSFGEASTSRIPLGIVIVGGVMFSLILTLYVVPAMYGFLSSKKRKTHEVAI